MTPMRIHYIIAFTVLLASVSRIIIGLVIPEAYSSSKPSTLTPRQEGYKWCHTEHPGTCSIAYIIDSTRPHPISIQVTDNNCDDALGGARNLDIGSTLADFETDSRRTDPVTKFTIQNVVNGEPEMTANGKELSWHPPAHIDTRTIHIATFDCHMR
ncbi:hypothetical protein BPAE_0360g00080 [Botrytis paeoniae]|uniref:Uncharacterized protein n=1 Tax=Botrytis paeoniae TaxID=278948 RepID=A0A4Z1FBX6_9HELO|nr:hypothetical protein BPAE_0360g00080 [Botrytis paeoniae]